MWKPWKGTEYERTRLLLLGESCYPWWEGETLRHPTPRHPTLVAKHAISKFPKTSNFGVTLTRGLTEEYMPDAQTRERGWARVAFTNYVPVEVDDGTKRPSAKQWKQATDEFPRLLRELRPRNVIVLGREMWNKRMPPEADLWLLDDLQGFHVDGGDTAICWALPHPRAGLSWSRLSDVIRYILGASEPADRVPPLGQ